MVVGCHELIETIASFWGVDYPFRGMAFGMRVSRCHLNVVTLGRHSPRLGEADPPRLGGFDPFLAL